MMKKKYILALTFLLMLFGQASYSFSLDEGSGYDDDYDFPIHIYYTAEEYFAAHPEHSLTTEYYNVSPSEVDHLFNGVLPVGSLPWEFAEGWYSVPIPGTEGINFGNTTTTPDDTCYSCDCDPFFCIGVDPNDTTLDICDFFPSYCDGNGDTNEDTSDTGSQESGCAITSCPTGYVIVHCGCVTEDIAVIDSKPYVVSVNYLSNGNILIKASDGIYKKPSAFNPNFPEDRRIMNLFVALLAKGLQGLNKGIIISSKANTDPSSKSPASASGTNIYLNTNGGYSTSLDKVNDFKSIIKHEIFHVDDNKDPTFKRSLATHADVYIKAAKDATFKNTTVEFQKGNAGSFANYLLNMDKTVGIFGKNEIRDKITEFNKNEGRVKIIGPQMNFSKGTLVLELQIDNKTPNYEVQYTYINE